MIDLKEAIEKTDGYLDALEVYDPNKEVDKRVIEFWKWYDANLKNKEFDTNSFEGKCLSYFRDYWNKKENKRVNGKFIDRKFHGYYAELKKEVEKQCKHSVNPV